MPPISTSADWPNLSVPVPPITSRSPIRTPETTAFPDTADDPEGRTITYYEYPTSLNGVAYAGTMIVPATGKQTFKTIEVAGARRLSSGWQVGCVVFGHQEQRPVPR